jgi:hypothetical protein
LIPVPPTAQEKFYGKEKTGALLLDSFFRPAVYTSSPEMGWMPAHENHNRAQSNSL